MTRPRCGNDPRAQLTDGDRQAIADFKAYLADRAALREIAEAALAAVESALGDTLLPAAREEALAGIVAVLPPPADGAAVLREAADAVFALEYDVMVGEEGDENMGSMREAWDVGTIHASQLLRRMADETATETPSFTPPAHYRRDDGVDCCVHAIPVGPDSCQACRELADDQPASGPTVVNQVVAALQAKAQALSVEAEEEMRRDLEEQAQVWHEAADLARRTVRKAARSAQPAAGARQDGAQP